MCVTHFICIKSQDMWKYKYWHLWQLTDSYLFLSTCTTINIHEKSGKKTNHQCLSFSLSLSPPPPLSVSLFHATGPTDLQQCGKRHREKMEHGKGSNFLFTISISHNYGPFLLYRLDTIVSHTRSSLMVMCFIYNNINLRVSYTCHTYYRGIRDDF